MPFVLLMQIIMLIIVPMQSIVDVFRKVGPAVENSKNVIFYCPYFL